MIDYIKGKLEYVTGDFVVVENNNVGYKINTSVNSISNFSNVGEEIVIYTEMIVREDSISLCGFSTRDELEMFKLLTSVSGVGTKVGMGILSSINYMTLIGIIVNRDEKALTTAQGVGKKTAQRIILELKDKVAKNMNVSEVETEKQLIHGFIDETSDSKMDDTILALVSLGYPKSEAQGVVKRVYSVEKDIETMIKECLKLLMSF